MKKLSSPSLRRGLSRVAVGVTAAGAIALAPTLDSPSRSNAVAQSFSSHPFNGHSIVYVQSGDRWREAFISAISARNLRGQAIWRYTVDYLDPSGGTEAGITPDRITTVETAQSQGLIDVVYDVSIPAGVDQMLAAHNAARQEVGVPDLTWSAELAEYAQAWANQLLREGGTLRHRSTSERMMSNVGENLSGSRSSAEGGAMQHPSRVVAAWVAEQADYDYASNSCAAGKVCGHYTQIVWRETTEVGCGVARDADATREVWVCNYAPAGNFVGERPY